MNPLPLTASDASMQATQRRSSLSSRLVLDLLSSMPRGRLELTLPDGTLHRLGNGEVGVLPEGIAESATLHVKNEAFFTKCILGGDIGFAESYLDGDWETHDLTALIAWFILNVDHSPALSGSRRRPPLALNLLRLANRLQHLVRHNSKERARQNIKEHYDLSNEFFSLLLDPSMMYSSALWTRPDLSLTEAQAEKNDALCQYLRLKPSDHVLEIGSGWGGWALHAAQNYGCRVTSITLSEQQLSLARRRIAEAQLSHRVEFRLQDYRDVEGTFDKVVSIEMLEAVGHAYQPAFFSAVNRLVRPGGLVAMQFITCPDSRYKQLRKGVDFIQKHIFPGSLLLSLNRVNTLMSREGGFSLQALRDFGPDYARTLRIWRSHFRDRLAEVRKLGFSERFLRKWDYYLCYCEAAFAMRNISVVHTLHSRPNNLEL